ncbi:MAG: hypothetical protein AB7R89_18525 [Dehalococcoidia bacterium]
MNIRAVTLAERPELQHRIGELEAEAFPPYINAEPTWGECFPLILSAFPELQLFVVDADRDALLAVASAVAFRWDGATANLPGYNDLLRRCLDENRRGVAANTLCGIMAITPEEHQGKGVARHLFAAVFDLIHAQGFEHFVIPVRPTLKHLYPNFSTEDYLSWKATDGRPFDPWIRSNMALSPQLLGIARDSIEVSAPIPQWEEWCGMQFPASGRYVIPGGHQLLVVDRVAGTARYAEDHIWFEYPIAGPDA